MWYHSQPLFFVLYEMQGLIPAIQFLFLKVEHSFCVKHIYNNFKIDFKGLELKFAMWKCAATITIREFEQRMEEMKELDHGAWEYLANIDPTNGAGLILATKLYKTVM